MLIIGALLEDVRHRRVCSSTPNVMGRAVRTCQPSRPGRLKQCGAGKGCPATGVPHTQPGSVGAASPSPRPMAGMDGARRMPPAAHALAVLMDGIEGAERSVRVEPPPAAGAAALGRARLLARLLAQARVAAEKHPPAGAGSTLRSQRMTKVGRVVLCSRSRDLRLGDLDTKLYMARNHDVT